MARDLTNITANANVNFIRATQAQIDSALAANKSDWAQGTFYLTKDTDRLYFAQSSSELVSLNQFIHFWTGSNLPNSTSYANLANNDIFYWTNQNALIICTNAQEGTFTQLNPDTFLKASTSAIGVTSNSNSAKVSLTVEDTYGAGTAVKDRVTGEMTIAGGENIEVAVSGNTITLTGTNTNDNTTYSLSPVSAANNTVKLRLTETPHTLGVAGTPVDHDINITGQNINVTTDGTDITLTANAGVNALTKTFDGDGVLTTQVKFGNTVLAQNTITPTIAYGDNDSETFKNGTATLNVYNKTQVDDLIAAAKAQADALTYKGIISEADADTKLVTGTTASTGVSIGDVYKASSAITNNNLSGGAENHKAKTGDLIIATGEYVNGVETITGWEVVPSGDDQLISVDQNTAKTVKIMDRSTLLGGIAVDGSTTGYGTIGVTQTVSGGIKTLTVAHGAAGATATTLGGSGTEYTDVTTDTTLNTGTAVRGGNTTSAQNAATMEIPTISGISYDSAGHITGITTATYKVLDSHVKFNSFVAGVSAANNQATISHTLTVDGQAFPDALIPKVYLKAKDTTGSLQITANGTTNTIELGLVWGEFA